MFLISHLYHVQLRQQESIFGSRVSAKKEISYRSMPTLHLCNCVTVPQWRSQRGGFGGSSPPFAIQTNNFLLAIRLPLYTRSELRCTKSMSKFTVSIYKWVCSTLTRELQVRTGVRFASFGDLVYIIIRIYTRKCSRVACFRDIFPELGKKHFRGVFFYYRASIHMYCIRENFLGIVIFSNR